MKSPHAGNAAAIAIAALLLAGAGDVGAAVLATDTETLGATAALTARLPASRGFTVAANTQVRVTLADVGVAPFTELKLVISRGAVKVAALDSAGQQQFDATPGDYKVQVAGVPAQSSTGTFQVEVRELTGNTVLRQFTDGIAMLPAPPTAQSGLDTSVQLLAGTYQVTLSDRSFPAALATVSLLLNPPGGGLPVTISGPCAATPCTQSFTVSVAGSYDLFVVATAADPDQAGLYSLKISGGPNNAVVYATTQPVGLMPAPTSITLPAAGGYTLSSADFAMPVALSSLKLRMMQGAEQLAVLDVVGSSVAFNGALAGTAQLFTLPRAAAGGLGTYAVGLAQGTQGVYRDARTLPSGFDATLNAGGYGYAFTVLTAGTYRLRLRDLNFPTAVAQLRAVVVQNDAAVQTVSGTNIDSNFALAAGPAFLAVIGNPAAASANSLMGISLAPQAGGLALLDQAQGVGPLFTTRTVNIPAAGSYDLAINDLSFPAAFAELTVAVTRGSELTGQIIGSNTLRFNAPAGMHSINLLARADAAAKYATWGFELADTPPAPTVTLSASPAAVSANGTTTITWSATNATSCVASGGWSGAKALSGTEVSPTLAAATTFTLACAGSGGNTSQSATVTIATAKKGGGALGVGSLLLLAALLLARRRLTA